MKYITILTIILFSSCSSRTAKVANNTNVAPVATQEQIEKEKRQDDSGAEFIGLMWVTLF